MPPIDEVDTAIRAKTGAIWVRSNEETRVQRQLLPLLANQGYTPMNWTVTRGLGDAANPARPPDTRTLQLDAALQAFLSSSLRSILFALDPAPFLDNQRDPLSTRAFKDTHYRIPSIPQESAKQLIVIDPQDPPSPPIPGLTIIDWPKPDRDELAGITDEILASVSPALNKSLTSHLKTNSNRQSLTGALLGLSALDAANALARSISDHSAFDIPQIAGEKRRLVNAAGLEWFDPHPDGLDAVGGLVNLKAWLTQRRQAFSQAARDFRIPQPRGLLLLGIPGGGKSLTAKAVATAWELPLLKFDAAAVLSKFVGDSESRMRDALSTAESIAPAILWIDEIEKGLTPASGESDGGTSTRIFGTFLTWMQEHTAPVFVIATANNISALPPEFLRAGRWDEIFFVDLPTLAERQQISRVMERRFIPTQTPNPILHQKLALVPDRTGAEIEQAYIDALNSAFARDPKSPAPPSTDDLIRALDQRIPIAQTMKEKIAELRSWASTRALPASPPSPESTTQFARSIEL